MSDTMPPERDFVDIQSEMVLENDIIPGSRPFIKVHLKGTQPNSNEPVLNKFYDNNIPFLNSVRSTSGGFPQGSYVALLGRDIVDAEFDAETLGTRRGHINITDPLGIWTEIIAKVSSHSDKVGRGMPNIEVIFGWIDLGGDEPDKIQSVYGLVTKTNFSLGENGVMSLTIHFVESAMDMLANLRFLKFEDMLSTDPDSDDNEIEDKETPNMALNKLINNSSLSTKVKTAISEGDEGQALTLIFDDCDDSSKNKVKMKNYSVRFGDKFYDKLQAIISKAKPPASISIEGEDQPHTVDTDANDYSYKIIEKKTYVPESDDGDIRSYIRYGWEVIPKEAEESPQNSDNIFPGASLIGNLFWKKATSSSMIRQYDTSTSGLKSEINKTALSVDIDLRSFAHLHALIQGQMNKYLNKMDDKDWKRTEEDLSDIASHPRDGWSDEEVLASLDRDGGWFRDRFGWGENEEDYEERTENIVNLLEMSQDMDDSEDSEGTPASSQIRALVRQFSFQMKTTILGDPAFGTYLPPARGYFISDFSGIGRFAGYLTGLKWLFMKATHKFSNDGTYKTELELRSTPPDAGQGGDSDTGEDNGIPIGGSFPDEDAATDFRGLGQL